MAVRRRCLGCSRLTAAGSYCGSCRNKRFPASPERARGRRAQKQRKQMLQAFAYRCAECGAHGVPLEVHHRDHDWTNNQVSNQVVLCRRCHARANRSP